MIIFPTESFYLEKRILFGRAVQGWLDAENFSQQICHDLSKVLRLPGKTGLWNSQMSTLCRGTLLPKPMMWVAFASINQVLNQQAFPPTTPAALRKRLTGAKPFMTAQETVATASDLYGMYIGEQPVNERYLPAPSLDALTSEFHSVINKQIESRIKSRLTTALKSNSMATYAKVETLIGCDLDQLRRHLERQFRNGMSWGNADQWHIDHVVPCSNYDLSDIKQTATCFHYTNLQPMWKEDNSSKSDRLPDWIDAL
jgi:hypothetical protein